MDQVFSWFTSREPLWLIVNCKILWLTVCMQLSKPQSSSLVNKSPSFLKSVKSFDGHWIQSVWSLATPDLVYTLANESRLSYEGTWFIRRRLRLHLLLSKWGKPLQGCVHKFRESFYGQKGAAKSQIDSRNMDGPPRRWVIAAIH